MYLQIQQNLLKFKTSLISVSNKFLNITNYLHPDFLHISDTFNMTNEKKISIRIQKLSTILKQQSLIKKTKQP